MKHLLVNTLRHLNRAPLFEPINRSLGGPFFETIYFDIVGGCNASCPLCVTGRVGFGQKIEQISTRDFARAVDRLLDIGLATPSFSTISLYNWAEPMLHSDLDGISEVLRERDLFLGISTNASKRSVFKGSTRHFSEFIFSVPGWSQSSQDKIHGFRHDRIVANMDASIDNVRGGGFSGPIILSYHVYQFNCFQEMEDARLWCESRGVVFQPYFAYINDYDPNKAFLTGAIDHDTLLEISKRLFLHYYDDLIRSQPDDWQCPQWTRVLSLNHKCEVLLCCVVPETNEAYSLGSVFELSREQILSRKTSAQECAECMSCGLAFWAHNPKMVEVSPLKSARHSLLSRLKLVP